MAAPIMAAPGIPLMKSAGLPANDPNCCCDCNCNFAPQAYTLGRNECISEAYGAPTYKTTQTFNISGTITLDAYWELSGLDMVQRCVGSGVPDPSGSWVFTVASATQYRHYQYIVCEDATYYYIAHMCMEFKPLGMDCATTAAGSTVGQWRALSYFYKVAKVGGTLPTLNTWYNDGSACNEPSDSITNILFRMDNYAGFEAWRYENGPYISPIDGVTPLFCAPSCNDVICRPDCNSAIIQKSRTDSHGSHNYLDFSGLTVTCAIT